MLISFPYVKYKDVCIEPKIATRCGQCFNSVYQEYFSSLRKSQTYVFVPSLLFPFIGFSIRQMQYIFSLRCCRIEPWAIEGPETHIKGLFGINATRSWRQENFGEWAYYGKNGYFLDLEINSRIKTTRTVQSLFPAARLEVLIKRFKPLGF